MLLVRTLRAVVFARTFVSRKKRSLKRCSPGYESFSLRTVAYEQRTVLTPVVTGARNLNRELFKGRRSLEPVGSRTDTVERGNVGNLVGWSCIENPEEFMSRGSGPPVRPYAFT